ncbi:hypothetical protein QBC41DRAFT_378615 [Cercophora samala]|uniref:Fe2OG dioxygenase domain-containing protein n=1 Tax=Cercophora samala TaxID=330535 RepID=A0AA40DDK6_9PEZI|nr:hypothetical protein QBC41DRAFT_378615 [Cercophora samala]
MNTTMANQLSIPPFPTDLPLAPLTIISHEKLLSHDPTESSKLLSACKNQGFFHLDLRTTPQGASLLAQSSQLYNLAQVLFDLPLEIKQQYTLQKGVSLFGYKPAGTIKATDPTRRPDATEFFNIGKDDLFHPTSPDLLTKKYPPDIQANLPLLKSFTTNSHTLAMHLLTLLARELHLPSDTALTDLNTFPHPSGDHTRLTRTTHPHGDNDNDSIALPSHTDFGTLTLLFNRLGGLQIESTTTTTTTATPGHWEWVKPLPGHAIVNLGDAMKIFTSGYLKSAKHRVVPLPGADEVKNSRYSVVYFVRPANHVLMKAVDGFERDEGSVKAVAGKFEPKPTHKQVHDSEGGNVLTAGEWMVQRAVQLGN